MISFQRRTWWQSAQRLIPALRRRQDAELAGAIQVLLNDLGLPCMVEGVIIPDGYGNRRQPLSQGDFHDRKF